MRSLLTRTLSISANRSIDSSHRRSNTTNTTFTPHAHPQHQCESFHRLFTSPLK